VSTEQLPKILCVDDEVRVVESLAVNLRKDFEVHTATSGEAALKKMRSVPGICVVVSDMRMPGMDGATLLQEIRYSHSGVSRILLTGEVGQDTAMLAVNKGQVMRYLTKPYPVEDLKKAIDAGVVDYRLAHAERSVLQETVLGCMHAFLDLLSVASPLAYERAGRIQERAMAFSARLGVKGYWQLEAAAMLSQIGYIRLAPALLQKLYRGEELTSEETAQTEEVPKVVSQLLERVPRLEPIMQILLALQWPDESVAKLGRGTIGLGTKILGMVLEFDAVTSKGGSPGQAIANLRARSTRYGEEIIDQYAAFVGVTAAPQATQTG
jgi:response regulator RpfG family c-di-GMP phosphodiesterase